MNIVILLGVIITIATGAPVLMQMLRHHPRGLLVLFFAEMWERFSFYGMRGLLIFYLTQHFLFEDKAASQQYGSYASLVYLLPLVGGIIADRYLGTRKAVAFGALLLVAGHLTMAVEGAPARESLVYNGARYEITVEGRGAARAAELQIGGQGYAYAPTPAGDLTIQNLPAGAPLPATLAKGAYSFEKGANDPFYLAVFYIALSLIIMGVGFLKPNISTIVGQLYPQGDPRRDPGFTLYYYGINLGAFWAAVLCGYLGQTVGWWAGFGLAGVGMLLGYIAFVAGKPLLQGKGEPPEPERLRQKVAGPLSREHLIYLGGVLGVGVVFFLVQSHDLVGGALGLGTAAALGFIGWFIVTQCTRVERDRMLLALVLIFGSVIFFTLFEQAGSSLNLFADRNVDLSVTAEPVRWLGGLITFATPQQLEAAGLLGNVGGLWIDTSITAAQTQSFNAGFILIFAPVFAALWGWLGRRGRDLNPVAKFGLGLVQVGLGFLVVVWGAGLAGPDFRVPLLLLGLLYLLHTTGELFLSPVGLSEITKLSVAKIVAFMMAVWFLASAIAHFAGGAIAGLAGTETAGGEVLDPGLALRTSLGVFQMLGWSGVAVGVVFLVLAPLLKRLSHGVNDPHAHAGVAPEPFAPTLDGEVQAVNPAVIRGEGGKI